jgi:hypothetical protein
MSGSISRNARDAGARDVGARDAGARDAGARDVGARDAGARDADAWDAVRRRLRPPVISLYPLGPYPPRSAISVAVCVRCRGPVRPGFIRCYQCARHDLLGRDLLADAVVPISYAVKGTAFAAGLWRYKSWSAPSADAQTSMLALLLAFLHDHGACVWRHAGMPAPSRLAVVPTGCGRPGPHPLLTLAAPYLRLPVTRLVIRPGEQGRDPNVNRFSAERTTATASVLLLEDTWVSGASAQSAAAALKRAGARHVAVVVLGRHVDPADRLGGPLAARLAPASYDVAKCAVHTQT